MHLNIIVPWHPLSPGSLSSPAGTFTQREDWKWYDEQGEAHESPREDIVRGVYFLNANSYFKHTILVAIDAEIFPHPSFLAEYENVKFIRATPFPRSEGNPYRRLAAAYRDAIATVPNEELICYGYTSDLICMKDWDWHIADAIKEYGDENVYVPMFVETKTKDGTHLEYEIRGTTPTPHQIWIEFREKVCCHGLTWPEKIGDCLTEEDFNEYIEIARRGHGELGVPKVIFENCGERGIGYYNVMCMKAKYAKIAGFDVERGMGFDIGFDDALRDKAHRIKGVVTDSYVYHVQSEGYHMPFQWEGMSAKWKRSG